MTTPDLVIYHGNCPDGFCAAFIATKLYPGVELMPAIYGHEPPKVEGRHVLMVDFSYLRPVVQRMRVEYEDRIRQLEVAEATDGDRSHRLFAPDYEALSREILQVERQVILQLRNERVINDEVLRRIQRDIDLAEARLHRRR